ncbi:LOW QUALITY PROTEIN: hypothetical protein H106_07355 [Trichophyton rubrum CBS 735.88]|nr:LOW QUALITY PROTEIN: hypothetical protein H106_07355 [Trichophyton rubrum CBS 735.88]
MDRGGMWTKLLSQELAEAKKVTSFRAHPAAHTIRPPRPKEPLLHRNQEPELRRHGDGKWHKRFSLLAIWPFFSLMITRTHRFATCLFRHSPLVKLKKQSKVPERGKKGIHHYTSKRKQKGKSKEKKGKGREGETTAVR